MANTASPDNVIVVSFADDSNAYAALTQLEEVDAQDQAFVQDAPVVARGDDGRNKVKDEVSDEMLSGTAGGGVTGLLIGILGGPLGGLIGGTTGMLVGSLYEIDDVDKTDSVLSQISTAVRPGHTALLAQVTERSPEVIDAAMDRLKGSVLRRPVADVEAEIAAAEKAQRRAKKKARKEMRKARRDQHEKEIHAKVDELQANFHQSKQASAPRG